MMYTLRFDSASIDYLNSLPNDIKHRIYSKIISTKGDPHHFFEKLTGLEGYKLRVSDYRVIAYIDDQEKYISILLIGHRKNIYKKYNK